METQSTLAEALERIERARTEGVVVAGDADEALLRRVLAACRPQPVRAAVYNTTDEVASAVAASGAVVRVGDAVEGQKPRLVVQTRDERISFADTITVRRSRPGWIREVYGMLVPFDGVSLASSTAEATPARQEVLAWLSGRKEGRSPAVTAYGRLRIALIFRGVLFIVGAITTVFWLVFPAQQLWLVAAVCTLVCGVFEQLDVRNLRRQFGTDSEHA